MAAILCQWKTECLIRCGWQRGAFVRTGLVCLWGVDSEDHQGTMGRISQKMSFTLSEFTSAVCQDSFLQPLKSLDLMAHISLAHSTDLSFYPCSYIFHVPSIYRSRTAFEKNKSDVFRIKTHNVGPLKKLRYCYVCICVCNAPLAFAWLQGKHRRHSKVTDNITVYSWIHLKQDNGSLWRGSHMNVSHLFSSCAAGHQRISSSDRRLSSIWCGELVSVSKCEELRCCTKKNKKKLHESVAIKWTWSGACIKQPLLEFNAILLSSN